MAANQRGRRESERIMKKYGYGNFKNTAETPMLIDLDDEQDDDDVINIDVNQQIVNNQAMGINELEQEEIHLESSNHTIADEMAIDFEIPDSLEKSETNNSLDEEDTTRKDIASVSKDIPAASMIEKNDIHAVCGRDHKLDKTNEKSNTTSLDKTQTVIASVLKDIPAASIIEENDIHEVYGRNQDVDKPNEVSNRTSLDKTQTGCNSMGSCNVSFLARMKNKSMCNNIDWCKYVYDKVRSSKSKWKRDDDMCFYAGPLTFITLLYVEATECDKVNPRTIEADMGKKAVNVWDMTLLRKRESVEIVAGGLGQLPIKVDFRVEAAYENGVCSHQPETRESKMGKDEMLTRIGVLLNTIMNAKHEATTLLKDAVKEFEGEPEFSRLMEELQSIFSNIRNTVPDPVKNNEDGPPQNTTPVREEDINKQQDAFHESADGNNNHLAVVVSGDADQPLAFDACWDSL